MLKAAKESVNVYILPDSNLHRPHEHLGSVGAYHRSSVYIFIRCDSHIIHLQFWSGQKGESSWTVMGCSALQYDRTWLQCKFRDSHSLGGEWCE